MTFTPEGRAWNPAGPTTGDTANAALLAAIYGQVHSQYITKAQSDRYVCFSRGQMRFVLGDKGQSLMVGYGAKFPTHVQVGALLAAAPAASAESAAAAKGSAHELPPLQLQQTRIGMHSSQPWCLSKMRAVHP